MRLEGHCHCNAIQVVYNTPASLQELLPRRCSCTFCTRHGAQWHSSPGSQLRVSGEASALHRYRFGTVTADFLLCRNCGVVLAAVSCIGGNDYAVVNLASIPGFTSVSESQVADFDGETVDERLQRRVDRWIPSVELKFV